MKEEPQSLKFFIEIGRIAAFLKVSEVEVRELIEREELLVKKDGLGRLVLCNLDYYRCIGGKVEEGNGKHGKRQRS